MNQNIEIAFNFTREIPLKILAGFKTFGGNTLVNRVSFVGGWWLVLGSVFYLHTPISGLTVYPSYTRPKGLAPLGNTLKIQDVRH